jgi:predicted DNA-binding protein (MmcQ/YjbR family)
MPVNQLKRVRRICLALPGASEKEAWGRIPTFRVGDSIFAMFTDNYQNDGRVALWLAAEFGVLEELLARYPERYFAPRQTRRPGWIGVLLDQNDDASIQKHVRDAYELIGEKTKGRRTGERRKRVERPRD